MRPLRLLLLVLLALGAAGCWDVVEVDRRDFISAIGLDAVSGPSIRVVAQFALTAHLLPSTTGVAPQRKRFFTLDTVSRTVLSGLANLQAETPRAIDVGQVCSVIMQDALARKGVKRHIDYILRSPKLSPRAMLFVSRGPTQKLLRQVPAQFVLPGLALGGQVQENPTQDQTFPMPLWSFAQRLDEYGQDPFCPVVFFDERNQSLVTTGVAAFRHDRLAGLLDFNQARIFGLVAGRTIGGYLEIPIRPDLAVAYRVVEVRSAIRCLNPDLTRFVIDVKASGYLGEYPGLLWGQRIRQVESLERQTEDYIRRESLKLVRLMQSWGSDILGLGVAARIAYPDRFRGSQWREKFAKAKVDVNIKFDITRFGLYD